MSPDELWARVCASPRPHKLIDFPRNDADGKTLGTVAIVVLTQEEQMLAAAETERYTKKAIKDLPKADDAKRGYDDCYNNRGAVEILFRACRRPDDPTRGFFPSPDEMQRVLTVDEVGILYRAYFVVQEELGPVVAHLSKEEEDAWIRRLKEAGSRSPLASLSWDAVSLLALSLASRMPEFAMSSDSSGSPPSSGSPNDTPAEG